MVDLYRDKAWREKNPTLTALHDRMQPPPPRDYYDKWRVLYYQKDGTWYRLTRGTWKSEADFCLSWGPDKDILPDLLSPLNGSWFTTRSLSFLITEAEKKAGIDILRIPLDQWDVALT
ncbi:MAG: hypothetical protein NVS4B9_39230 [Ktedonobacteraceae bacterium]